MIADEKLRSIRSILRNEVYTPESAMYQKLEETLNRLSAYSLAALDLIIRLKLDEARDEGRGS